MPGTAEDLVGASRLIALAIRREQAARGEGMSRSMYPDHGPLSRAAYPQHMAFFAAGATHRWRLALGANRVGKSIGLGGYELALHLTGQYPLWWPGRRFTGPIRAWAVGKSAQTTRDIVQEALLGPPAAIGSGLVPRHLIVGTARKAGNVPDAIEYVRVQHVSGEKSTCYFKSYDQQRKSFEGVYQHVIWLDEECPVEIHGECSLRIMPTHSFEGGMLMNTFTPLQGLSPLVLEYCPGGEVPEVQRGARHVTLITWADVPHLSAEVKAEFLAQIPPYQRDARTKGLPVLGAGVIYPVPEDTYMVAPFEIPGHWRRAYGMDVGWHATAIACGAYDVETDTWTVYHEYKRGESEPSIHADAIRGTKVKKGVIDPAARGRSQSDGASLMDMYRHLGLDLSDADNGVESGIYQVWQRLSAGRLKIFTSCTQLRQELRTYHRDERGKVVKDNDHLCDAMRYLCVSGLRVARAVDPPKEMAQPSAWSESSDGWMRG